MRQNWMIALMGTFLVASPFLFQYDHIVSATLNHVLVGTALVVFAFYDNYERL